MNLGSMRQLTAGALLFAGVGVLLGARPLGHAVAVPAEPIEVTWLGHAAFLIVSPGGTQLLIDPWLKGDPATPDSLQDLSRYHPDFVLATHSHFDHVQDVKAIATASGAVVVGAYDWVASLGLPDRQALGGNVGGTIKARDVLIHLVPAVHGSVPDGRPSASCSSSPVGARSTTRGTPGSSATWRSSRSSTTRASCS